MFVTRVSSFLEQNEYKLSYEGSADIDFIRKIVASHTFTVSPGANRTHANLSICYVNKITLNFSIRDLHQEQSPMIQSMRDSVVEDTSSDEYDYWDSIPHSAWWRCTISS